MSSPAAVHAPGGGVLLSDDEQQAAAAENAFRKKDIDGSGTITIDELQGLADYMGLPVAPEDVEQTHAMLDTDSSGALELHEWVDWWVARARGNPSPQKQLAVVARNAFASADEDGSGYLDLEELGALCEDLGAALESDEEIKSAMAMLDRDGNGTLDKDEFVRWWVGRTLEGSRGKLAEKLTRLAEVGRRRAHTSIHQAAWEGDSELVLDFLKVDARLVNAPDTAEYGEGFRPLQYAAYCGHLQICQLLLEGGAQINATNECGCTALFYAAQQGHLDVVKWLMQLKADVTPCERKTGFSALDVASLHEGMREEILEQAACISPPQPAQPKIVQRGAGSVKVFLEPPPLPRDCLRILQYKVKLLDFDGKMIDLLLAPAQKKEIADGSGLVVTFRGLRPETQYSAAVAAVNSVGCSPYSEPSEPVKTADQNQRSRGSTGTASETTKELPEAVSRGMQRAMEAQEKRQKIQEAQQKFLEEQEKHIREVRERKARRLQLAAAKAFASKGISSHLDSHKDKTDAEKQLAQDAATGKAADKLMEKLKLRVRGGPSRLRDLVAQQAGADDDLNPPSCLDIGQEAANVAPPYSPRAAPPHYGSPSDVSKLDLSTDQSMTASECSAFS